MTIERIQSNFLVQNVSNNNAYSFENLFQRITNCILRFFECIRDCFKCMYGDRQFVPLIPPIISNNPSPTSLPITTPQPQPTAEPSPSTSLTTTPSQPVVLPQQIETPEEQAAARAIWNEQMNHLYPHGNLIETRRVNLGSLVEPAVRGICAPLGYEQLPYIGTYGASYTIYHNLLAVKLPKRQLAAFPDAIKNQLAPFQEQELDIFFLVCMDAAYGDTKRNIIYHALAYPQIQRGQTRNENHLMGMYDPQGIFLGAHDPINNMPINRSALQNIHLHPQGNQMAVSPDNARFYIDPLSCISSFYSFSLLPNHRAAACFTVMIHDNFQGDSRILQDAVRLSNSPNLMSFFRRIQESDELSVDLLGKIQRLLTFQT